MATFYLPPLENELRRLYVLWESGEPSLHEILAIRDILQGHCDIDRASLLKKAKGTRELFLGEYSLGEALDLQREGSFRELRIELR